MGTPEYIDDERYDRNPKRVAAHKEVKVIVENWTMTKTVDVLIEEMLAAGIPCAPINNIKQVVEDPHIADAREMFVEIDHPKAGKMKITGSHIKLYETMPEVNTPAPTLGEHNQEILKDFLGYDDATIQSLSDQKVI
jgi:formyl-CoA transferase